MYDYNMQRKNMINHCAVTNGDADPATATPGAWT